MAALATSSSWLTLGLLLMLAGFCAMIAGFLRLVRQGKPRVLTGGLLLAVSGWICLRIAHSASAAV